MKVSDYENVFRQNQTELSQTVYNILCNYYPFGYVQKTDSYIYAIGTAPIALVAHLDTVWESSPPKFIFYDQEKGAMWNPTGLGADDRAGVVAIINIIRQASSEGFLPHVIFTHDEEIGGLGAKEIAQLGSPFPQLKYIIELDREGAEDCVFYECENNDFQKYVELFGFKKAIGTFSDISYICPSWGVCGVNLSIGYYNEHTVCEIFFPEIMNQTISKVMNMLRQESIPDFQWQGSTLFSVNKLNADKKQGKGERCCVCNKPVSNSDGQFRGINIKDKYFCLSCAEKNIAFCALCGEAYENKHGIDYVNFCPKCLEELGCYYD